MLGKPVGFVWTTALGVVALLAANMAHAAIDLDAPTKSAAVATYAKETLLTTGITVEGTGDGKTYYVVTGPSDLLDVTGKIGIGGFENTQFNITYELHGMVFATPVGSGDLGFDASAIVGANIGTPAVLVASGGAKGDSQVTFAVQRAGVTDSAVIVMLDLPTVGVSPGSMGGVAMTATEGAVQHMSSYPGAVRIANALKESKMVDTPTATVADGFMKFGDDLMAPVGSLWLSHELYLTPLTGAPLIADMLTNVTGPDVNSSIVFSGDFSFASEVKLGSTATCVAAAVDGNPETTLTGDLLQRDDDGAVEDIRKLMPVMASVIGAGKYLCIFVRDPEAEDAVPIPATGKYMVTTKYGGVENAAFPPSGTTLELGYIKRDGTTVQIPYLTQFGDYNQRIVIVNRGAAADYSFSFTAEEDGPTITPGADASGTLAAGFTTYISMKYGDLVTIDGSPNRVSGTLIVESEPHFIDVVVSQTNANGGTDTVKYTDN